MDEVTFNRRARDGVLRLTVAGPVVATNAWRLRIEVNDALRDRDASEVELDLAGVPLLDSSGISALIASRTAAQSAGRSLSVVNPRPPVHRALRVLGLLDVLRVASAPTDSED